MKWFLFSCVAAQLIIVNSWIISDLPEPCHKNDPNFRACFLKYLNKAIPQVLPKGIPEYNISPMDPLSIPIIFIDRTSDDFLSVEGTLKNLKVFGLSRPKITDLKIDLERLEGEIETVHSSIQMTGAFKAVGELVDVPFESQASFKGTFTNITFRVTIKLAKEDASQYFTVDEFKFKTTFGECSVQLSSKNHKNQAFDNFLRDTFNHHTKDVLDLIAPTYDEVMENAFRSVLEQGLAQIPAEKLLPE